MATTDIKFGPCFTFDTSGRVARYHDHPMAWAAARSEVAWSDLSPFMQGYVRAAFETVVPVRDDGATVEMCLWEVAGFSDLAPATLAAMMAVCEKRISLHAPLGWSRDSETQGREFFRRRQKGDWAILFPPVTLQIHDDGLVYQEARS